MIYTELIIMAFRLQLLLYPSFHANIKLLTLISKNSIPLSFAISSSRKPGNSKQAPFAV